SGSAEAGAAQCATYRIDDRVGKRPSNWIHIPDVEGHVPYDVVNLDGGMVATRIDWPTSAAPAQPDSEPLTAPPLLSAPPAPARARARPAAPAPAPVPAPTAPAPLPKRDTESVQQQAVGREMDADVAFIAEKLSQQVLTASGEQEIVDRIRKWADADKS